MLNIYCCQILLTCFKFHYCSNNCESSKVVWSRVSSHSFCLSCASVSLSFLSYLLPLFCCLWHPSFQFDAQHISFCSKGLPPNCSELPFFRGNQARVMAPALLLSSPTFSNFIAFCVWPPPQRPSLPRLLSVLPGWLVSDEKRFITKSLRIIIIETELRQEEKQRSFVAGLVQRVAIMTPASECPYPPLSPPLSPFLLPAIEAVFACSFCWYFISVRTKD